MLSKCLKCSLVIAWVLLFCFPMFIQGKEGLPLYYWHEKGWNNFGDYISLKLVERIVNGPIAVYKKNPSKKETKLLAIGSILWFAEENDVLWGTGYNGKYPNKKDYKFNNLDIRAIRGPLARDFIVKNFQIKCPEIYGDPALLFPYFFPEFKKKINPKHEYLIIPHYSEVKLFPKSADGVVVYPTDPWDVVVNEILDSKFVISSSLHGLVIADAYGIPARWLRLTENEPEVKYHDYYLGTNRENYQYANSIEEALLMGGADPFVCDLTMLYEAFPFDLWPDTLFKKPNFSIFKHVK